MIAVRDLWATPRDSGVAGLEAVATAHRLGAVVEGYDVRPETLVRPIAVDQRNNSHDEND
jgi:NAD/NADP transhydrogenase alpha subunit